MATTDLKRANFDLTPEQEDALTQLRAALSASSMKDTILRAAQITSVLVKAVSEGNQLFIGRTADHSARLVIPELEGRLTPQWKWLVERPHPWKRTPTFKGRRLSASDVWLDARTNGMSVEEAAEDWKIPLEAMKEAFAWCEANQALIEADINEERVRARAAGIELDPPSP